MMQPELPTPAQWTDINAAVIWLLAMTGFVLLFAGSLLATLAIVPSTLATGTLPARFAWLRMVFAILAQLALLGALAAGLIAVLNMATIYDIYGKVWI